MSEESGGSIELERDFEVVWPFAAEVLRSYLGKRGNRAERVEDLVQETAAKLWIRKEGLKFQTEGQWLAYVKQVADNIAKDTFLKETREVPTDESYWADVGSGDFERELTLTLQGEGLVESAHDLWLGKRPQHHAHRLAAAMLVLADGRRPSEVLALISQEGSLSSENLPELLGSERTVREVAYRRLHLEPNQIAEHVLGAKPGALSKVVSAIARDCRWRGSTGDWSPLEARIALQKCCDFEQTSVLLRYCTHEKHTLILGATVRLREHLPFKDSMTSLLQGLERIGVPSAALAEPGLWKRLTFQYCAEGLPHGDLVDWFGTPGALCGFVLSPMRVHSWISNGRLASELRNHLQKEWEGHC